MADPSIPTCPSCRYELRGLPLRGQCPECGNSYALSLPGLEPGSMPPSSRYQRFAYDAGLSRTARIKGLILFIIGVGIVAAWKAADAKGGGDGAETEALNYLIRYGITLGLAIGIYFFCCAISAIEFAGLSRILLGIAGALAGADLAHHFVYSIGGWMLLGLPWFVGFVVYVGLTADLLDIDLTEAGLLGVLTLAGRILLKFTLFDQMFAKS